MDAYISTSKSSSLHSFVFLLLLPLFFLLGGANVFRSHHSASNHAKKTGHSLALNIQRTRKPDSHQRSPSAEPPLKKLAITEQTQDLFDIKTSLIHYAPDDDRKELSSSDLLEPKVSKEKKNFCDRISFFQKLIVFAGSVKIDLAVAAILAASSSTQISEVKAWEEEIETCHHVVELDQDPNAAPVTQGCLSFFQSVVPYIHESATAQVY